MRINRKHKNDKTQEEKETKKIKDYNTREEMTEEGYRMLIIMWILNMETFNNSNMNETHGYICPLQ